MELSPSLTWLLDEAGTAPTPEWFLAELGRRLLFDGLPIAGGALTLAAPHPIVTRRTWLWRAVTGEVIEALSFSDVLFGEADAQWLSGLGPVEENTVGKPPANATLGWAGARQFTDSECLCLRDVARFAAPSVAALSARAGLSALLEAYLGRRSAARVQAGAMTRGVGETIQATLLCADLRDFTALSEETEPAVMIATLDAWFERIAGAVHAFGGEVLKFMGDGVLAIFPVTSTPGAACEAALRAVSSARAGMAHLDTLRQNAGAPALPFGIALHFGEILWGNVGAADRLDFTAIGPAVNLVSRLEGLCKPLGHTVLVSGAVATEVTVPLVSAGHHRLRGIAEPCAVFTLAKD
ncbi:adenylate/guanylate cyclase domain-containing protein [Rhizobium grahamii]|uniref:Adenylate cyclase n=2 Tax=Rhizobium grahamii TaxID=1120045 RepID=S3H9N8_9HYPH|nr:adenylate/guanylate cyclase domain-containing protein [Rhizobium grahamii]EPE94925.1 adenylate cyclase [Rhizobium grahamii CCGE 502]RDJ05703.1 adenylate/guanylate cyclase domain-containing protein [Rhizobium grahamii]